MPQTTPNKWIDYPKNAEGWIDWEKVNQAQDAKMMPPPAPIHKSPPPIYKSPPAKAPPPTLITNTQLPAIQQADQVMKETGWEPPTQPPAQPQERWTPAQQNKSQPDQHMPQAQQPTTGNKAAATTAATHQAQAADAMQTSDGDPWQHPHQDTASQSGSFTEESYQDQATRRRRAQLQPSETEAYTSPRSRGSWQLTTQSNS